VQICECDTARTLFTKKFYFLSSHQGNRDINKLRLRGELHKAVANKEKKGIDNYFTPNRPSLQQFYVDNPELCPAAVKGEADIIDPLDYQICSLNYILEKTMSAVGAFKNRRTELELLGYESNDQAVFNSFYKSVDPEGE
jgi:hypothetical protein